MHKSSFPSNITPLYFFSSKNIYFVQKEPMKVKKFWDCGVLGSKTDKFLMSIFKRQDNSSSNFASLCIVTFENSGKNLPNPSCHFSNKNSVFLQILHHSLVSWNITPLHYFSSKILYLAQKEPIKVYIFETFWCSS